MNHFPFHASDYLRDTAHLSIIEDCIYRRALDWSYINEKPLPADPLKVARLLRATQQTAEVESILNEFFVLGDDGWTQDRVQRTLNEYHEKVGKASKAGKTSAERRSNTKATDVKRPVNDRSTDDGLSANTRATDVEQPLNVCSTSVERPLNERATNHKPITNNQEPYSEGKPSDASPSVDPLDLPFPEAKAETPPAPPAQQPIDGEFTTDARQTLWTIGVPMLVAAGGEEYASRKVLGAFVKKHGEDAVAEAVLQSRIEKPIDPVAYIGGLLKAQGPKGRGRRSDEPATGYGSRLPATGLNDNFPIAPDRPLTPEEIKRGEETLAFLATQPF